MLLWRGEHLSVASSRKAACLPLLPEPILDVEVDGNCTLNNGDVPLRIGIRVVLPVRPSRSLRHASMHAVSLPPCRSRSANNGGQKT